jgi:hypothetical protein
LGSDPQGLTPDIGRLGDLYKFTPLDPFATTVPQP